VSEGVPVGDADDADDFGEDDADESGVDDADESLSPGQPASPTATGTEARN